MSRDIRSKRLARAEMKVLLEVPFFAPAIMRLPVTFDPAVETACTDGTGIKWNPDWFDSLPDAVLPTVLCHEAAHCLLGHVWRAPAGVDWQTWNEACDHAVNTMIKDWTESVMNQNNRRLANPLPFPDPPEAYCANPQFSGWAEEKIYSCLSGRKPKQPGGGGNQPQGQGQSKGQGQGQQPGKSGKQPGQPNNQPAQGKPDPHSMPSFGQMIQQKGVDPAQQKKDASNWDQVLAQSVAIGKGRGNIPAGLARFVDQKFNPRVPWFELLRNWLREQASDDWNWMKPNQYFDDSEFILPSLDSDRIGAIVIGKDTSGSIDRDALARFNTEEQAALDDLKPAKLVDICCDGRVHQVKEYHIGDTIDPNAPGGGGTDFRPVFEYAEKMDVPVRALVYLTDLDGTFPDKAPDYPVLWITWEKNGKAPFGEVVYVPSND